MDTFRSLQALVRSIELGSLSAAARELGTTQPTVSKVVAALERSLQVRLIERTTTRLTPTDAGVRFHEAARRILDHWAEATAAARDDASELSGSLRVSVPLGFGEVHMSPIVGAFLERHPALQVDLVLDDRYVDLVEERIDLALRLGGPLPASAVARPLAQARRYVVASPAYLARHAPIRRPADLAQHAFVRYARLSLGTRVALTGPGGATAEIELDGRYSVNSGIAVREAARGGHGLALAPSWLVQSALDDGTLVRVLPRWEAPGHLLRVVYPSRRYQPARTRAFLAHLAEALRTVPGLEPYAGDDAAPVRPAPRRRARARSRR